MLNNKQDTELLHAILETIHNGIISCDSQGVVRSANPASGAIFGYAVEEVVKQNIKMLLAEPHRSEYANFLSRYNSEDKAEIIGVGRELLGLHKDGGTFPVRITLNETEVAGEIILVAVIEDRTEEKRIEEDLQKGWARYRDSEEVAQLGHWVWDEIENKCIYCSEEYAKILGLSVDEYLSNVETIEADLLLVHPEDREMYQEINGRVAENNTGFDIEYRIVRSGGEIRYVREIATVILNENDEVVESSGIMQDITDRKALEDQLRQSQKMEIVGHLAGGVAHDFNNLLGIVLGNAEMLEFEIKKGEVARRNVESIIKAANRGASLTARLLAFSRKQALSSTTTAINGLVLELEDMLRRTLGATIEFRVHLGPGNCKALVDPHQLENALLNLSINARDAMANGGMLTIETANVTLDETYAEQHEEVTPGDYVMVAVTDTGTGMSPEIVEKVFEPFFTTKDVGKGSGLGLSMVFGFIKQSGGHIMVYSEVGLGTTVKLYIPVSRGGIARKSVIDQISETKQGSESILVVEDDEELRKIPADILRRQGYGVMEAKDGKEAIKCLQDGPPFDLLFADLVLPGGMNGMEVAEEAMRIQPNIRVLYTTGYAEKAILQRGKLDTAAALVRKPYRRSELLEKIRAILDDVDN